MGWRLLALGLLLTLVGCGGGSKGPGPSPTPTSVTITGGPAGVLFLGESYTLAMNAALSNGTTVTTGGTWGSDAPAVATVNSVSGVVQIVGLGEATIFVDYQGVRGTRRIRSTVRYEGTLDGAMRLTKCTQTGRWATERACSDLTIGDMFFALGTFTQSETTVTAVMDLGEEIGDAPSAPVATTISGSGELNFETVHQLDTVTIRTRWIFRPVGLTQVEGTAVLRFTASGWSGYLEASNTILPTSILRTLGPAGGARGRSILSIVEGRRFDDE